MRDISYKELASYTGLPKRRGEVLIFLARHGPSIVGKVSKGIDAYYPNTWNNIRVLKKMGLIKKMRVKDQRFPEYWITPMGFAAAMDLGVEPVEIMPNIPSKGTTSESERLVQDLCDAVNTIGLGNYRRMNKAILLVALAKQIEENLQGWEETMDLLSRSRIDLFTERVA